MSEQRWPMVIWRLKHVDGSASDWREGEPPDDAKVFPNDKVERLKVVLQSELSLSLAREQRLREALKRADEKLAHITHRIRAVQSETIGDAPSSVPDGEGR